jgi:hypothetical protein
MGQIKETATQRKKMLEADHMVGRAQTSALCINERYVSAQHAILRFTGDHWELRDLGSRNGTFLNGQRLKPGDEHIVRVGAQIAFGKLEQVWEVIDDDAPLAMAVPLDGGEPLTVEGELLALPSSEDPRLTIYRDPEGMWVLEQPEAISPITNLQTFDVDGRTFRFSCPESSSKTSLMESPFEVEVRHLALLFSVSLDEEHVALRATCGASSFELGTRAHNYLLLTLARRRVADAAEGLPETSCGWIYQEDFPHDPAMASPHLNLDVLRIRKQFSALGVVDAANIIERRPRTRQLRIGVSRISIVSL